MKLAHVSHKLYEVAFGHLRETARKFGQSLRQAAKADGYKGKVLRRGTHGAFGFDLRPLRSAKSARAGYNAPGNLRDRRFARRHPQHFNPAI